MSSVRSVRGCFDEPFQLVRRGCGARTLSVVHSVEALARFVPLVCDVKAPEPPATLRAHLLRSLPPPGEADSHDEAERWLARWGLTLAELSRENLADVERRLGIGDAGQPLAQSTAGRYRKVSHTCIRRAVELGRLDVDPWPSPSKGRSRRKAVRKRDAVDVRRLPDGVGMAAILQAIRSHQPGSRTYQAMTAVARYAGLRPSEVVTLRPRALHLPNDGWGRIEVVDPPQTCRANWKALRRRYSYKGWQLGDGGVGLFGTRAVPVTRYRYRGSKIPTPWDEWKMITASSSTDSWRAG